MPKMPNEDALNYVINDFIKKDLPSINDLNKVRVVADIQYKLLEFEAQGKKMSVEELIEEKHNSKRLSINLTAGGEPKPNNYCHCHAMVSGRHPRAAPLRAIIAWHKVRVDSYHNGCWLPENSKAVIKMPLKLRKAVPHSRIHRNGYYFWLNNIINDSFFEKETQQLHAALKVIKHKLETSTFPEYVMLSAAKLRKLEAKG